MNITESIIATALSGILRQRLPRPGMCIGMDTLDQEWRSTGLRSSDLQQALRDLERADLIKTSPAQARGYVELTPRGAERLFSAAAAEASCWDDDVALYRIRQRLRGARAEQPHRRTGDRDSPACG